MNTGLLVDLMINGVIVGALYGVVAISFVLIYKSTKVLNFAQGEFLLIGAWVCWTLLVRWQLPLFLAFPICLVGMLAFGVLVQVALLRPLTGEPIISVIMATIGLSIFLDALTKLIFGATPQPFPDLLSETKIHIFGLRVAAAYVASLAASLLIMAGFAVFFRYSRLGLAMRAASFDRQAAQSMGVSIQLVAAMAWAISAAVSAVAGITVGVVNGVSSGLASFGIKVFPVVILGGLDSIVGGAVGGLIIGLIENIVHYVDTQFLGWGGVHETAPFYILVFVLMVFPYGLFGTRDIERV